MWYEFHTIQTTPTRRHREWCCPACVTGATAIHQCAQVDPSLPPLAWRMQRGLFLPPGWEALLASEEHKALARRALGEDGAWAGLYFITGCRARDWWH